MPLTAAAAARERAGDSLRDANLRCNVFASWTALEPIRAEWDDFLSRAGGDIYLSFDWCRTWWLFYGGRRELCVFVLRSENRIVGLAPLFVDRVWIGPVWIRIAKVVGSDFGLGLFDPPFEASHAEAGARQIIDELVLRRGCDAILFGALAGARSAVAGLRSAAQACAAHTTVAEDAAIGPYTVFCLPEDFETYLAGLDKRQRGNFRRDWNLLNRNFTVQTDILTGGPMLDAEFAEFQRLHGDQWAREGRLGHFGDWPQSAAFHRALAAVQAANGRLRLTRLLLDGQPVSYQYCFVFGRRYHWFLPARRTGADWDRYGLGRLGMLKMFEAAVSEKIQEIEAGPAHYDYKVNLGGTESTRRTLVLVARCRGARMRVALFRLLSRWLHVAYFKIWFMRIAPRLPFPRRPLWEAWIRTRI